MSTASVGVAVSAADMTADELLANADAAMYRGKGLGGGRAALYDDGLREQATTQLRVEEELREALAHDDVLVHFQPIVDPGTLRCTSLEALVRWRHPQRGVVGPSEFIPVAEASGLIIPLGARVLDLALAQLAAWRQDDVFADVTVAVNVSAAQLRQPSFVAMLRATLERVGLPASALTLEITERVLLLPDGPAVQAAHALCRLGVHLALDDFGTGYSSLSTLRSLPVTTLKIDRSFVGRAGPRRRRHGRHQRHPAHGPGRAAVGRRRGRGDRRPGAPAARDGLRPRAGLPLRATAGGRRG